MSSRPIQCTLVVYAKSSYSTTNINDNVLKTGTIIEIITCIVLWSSSLHRMLWYFTAVCFPRRGRHRRMRKWPTQMAGAPNVWSQTWYCNKVSKLSGAPTKGTAAAAVAISFISTHKWSMDIGCEHRFTSHVVISFSHCTTIYDYTVVMVTTCTSTDIAKIHRGP